MRSAHAPGAARSCQAAMVCRRRQGLPRCPPVSGRTRACVSSLVTAHVPPRIISKRCISLAHTLEALLALVRATHIRVVLLGQSVELVLDLSLARRAWHLQHRIKVFSQHTRTRVQRVHACADTETRHDRGARRRPRQAPRPRGHTLSGGLRSAEPHSKFLLPLTAMANDRPRTSGALVLDAAPLLAQARIAGLADKYYIPASVLAELRDARARAYLEQLQTTGQIQLEVREPGAAAMQKGTWQAQLIQSFNFQSRPATTPCSQFPTCMCLR